MKFAKTALSLLFLSRAATAWTARAASRNSRVFGVQLLHAVATDAFSTQVIGEAQTESFRLAFTKDSKMVSPWHDIPLINDDGNYNMVRAVPFVLQIALL
jgi:hypothetical protein